MLLWMSLLCLVALVTLGTAVTWLVAEAAAPLAPRPPATTHGPGRAAALPSPPRRPAPAPLTVHAVVVLWSEVGDVATLDCVRADGPRRGAPFATSAALPAHPALATATENLLERWCSTATPISTTALAGRRGPELRLSDGDAWIDLEMAA